MPRPTIYEDTSEIVRVAEDFFLEGTSSRSILVETVWRKLVAAIPFTWKGIRQSDAGKAVVKFTMVALLVIALVATARGLFDASTNAALREIYMLAIMLLPIALTAFALPSTYMRADGGPDLVEHLQTWLRKRDQGRDAYLTGLKENLLLSEGRAKTRLGVMRFVLGLLWAGWAWFFSQIDLTRPPIAYPVTSSSAMFDLAALFLSLAAIFFVVEGYARAVEIIFASVSVAIIERTFEIATPQLPDADAHDDSEVSRLDPAPVLDQLPIVGDTVASHVDTR